MENQVIVKFINYFFILDRNITFCNYIYKYISIENPAVLQK
jgi:hypothetical protein